MATPRPFLAPALEKAMVSFDIRDSVRKGLREMSIEAIGKLADETLANAKSMTALGRGLRPAWRFGTVVQHLGLDVRAIVLTDDGARCKVMTMQYHEVIETGRSVWTPVED